MRIRPTGATSSMSRFPNMSDGESEHGTDHATRERAGEVATSKVDQAARRDVAPHSREQRHPRSP